MSFSNFELVMVGEAEEDKSNLVAETGFPFPPELCSQDCDELPPLQLEELDIKDEELNDVDEQTETDSTRWSMSPSPSDKGQTAVADGTFSDTEVTLKNPPRTTTKGVSKSVFYNVPHHSQKPPQQDNKLRVVQLQNLTQRQRRLNVQGENIQQSDVDSEPCASVLNILPIVSGPRRVPTMPNINVPQHSLLKANQASNDEILLSVPVHIIMQSNETMENINNSNNNEVSNQLSILITDQSENSQKNSVSPITVHKNMNSTSITGKTICKIEIDENLDPLAVDYHCINCNEDFDNPLLLKYHDCPDPTCKFHCKMCPKKFISSKTLHNHIVNKHLDLNIVDNNVEDVPVIHLRRVEEWYSGKIYSPKPNLTCAVCKYATTSKKSLKLHIKSHFKIKYFKCKFCEARFLTNFNLKMHCKKFHNIETSKIISDKINTKMMNPEKQFKCKKCNIKFKTNLAHHIHMKRHSDSYETKPNLDHGKILKKKYKCIICKKSFNSRSKVDDHIFNAHDRQKIAQLCRQNINSGSDSESESRFACKECDFKCTSKSELQNHVNFHLIFKFKCKHCGIFLMNESELDKHLKISHKSDENATLELSVHTDDNVATTNKVDNATSTNSRRQNITQYPCKYCGKIYVYSSTVEYHQKTQHKEECDLERDPQKLTKYKISTMENKIKTIVRKARKQNLVLREDENVATEVFILETKNVTSPSPDYLSDNSNQEGNSSGAENDDFQTEEVTDLSEKNPDSSDETKSSNDIQDKKLKSESTNPILISRFDACVNYYECNLCKKKFSVLSEVYKHGEKYHEVTVRKLPLPGRPAKNGSFQCKVCDNSYFSFNLLRNHMLLHRNIRPYPCKYCGKYYSSSSNIIKHYKKSHTKLYNADNSKARKLIKEKRLTGKISNNVKNNENLKTKTNTSMFKNINTFSQYHACSICKIYFSNIKYFYQHVQKHHSNNFVEIPVKVLRNGPHKCDECAQSFTSICRLKQHKLKHRDILGFPCVFCTDFCVDHSSVLYHYNKCHKSEWKLHRQKNKERKISGPLENLKRTYMFEGSKFITLTEINKKVLSFECHDCKLIFKTRDEAHKHCKIKHNIETSDDNFCMYCQEIFSSRKQLNIHYRIKHGCQRFEESKKQPPSVLNKEVENVIIEFCCNICDRTFDSHLELQQHQQTLHDLDVDDTTKLFYCDDCGQEFVTFDVMKGHIISSSCKNNTKSQDIESTDFSVVPCKERNTNESDEILKRSSNRLKPVDIGIDTDAEENTIELPEKVENGEITSGKNSTKKNLQKQKLKQLDTINENEESHENLSDSMESNEEGDLEIDHKKVQFSQDSPDQPQILINHYNARVNFYECNLCHKRFSTLTEVFTHGEKLHEITVKELPYCRQAKKGGYFQCKVCDSSYSYLALLRNHMLLHRNIRPFPCKYCGKFYSSSSKVIRHYKKSHIKLYNADSIKAKKLLEEKRLTGIISNNVKKNENLKSKTNTSIFNNVNTFSQLSACSMCKIYFSNTKYLYQHVQKHHSNNFVEIPVKVLRNGPHKCDECAQSFTSICRLKQHKLKHRDILGFPCMFCTKFCVDYSAVTGHYGKYHNSEWKLHRQKKKERKISGPLKNVKRKFMFEGSKYITLTDINKKRLAFECHDCKLIFNTRDETLDHSKIKHSQFRNDENGDDAPPFSFQELRGEKATHCCKYCRELFRSMIQLNIHYWIRHESERLEDGKKKPPLIFNTTLEAENVIEFPCDICYQKFDSHSKLLQHQHNLHYIYSDSVTKNEKLFYCDDCRQEFTNYIVLKKHITSSACKREIKSLELKTSEGETCQKKSLEGGNNSIAESSELNLFTCNHCNSSFDTKLKLKTHIKSHKKYHQVNDPTILKFICKLCNKIFKSHSRVKNHLCINVPRMYTCVVCKAIFESKHLYVIHKTTHEKSFTCEICGLKFAIEKQLQTHTIRRHEEHKFLCSLCGRKFPFSSCLNAHMKRHENIEYSCNKCDKKFLTLKQKQQHYNMVHSSVCLFCKTCSQSFSRKDHLDEHERRHAKANKTFKCEFCNQIYSCKSAITYHILTSHMVS